MKQWYPGRVAQAAICLVEYTIAAGAVANVALVSYELGIKSVSAELSDWVMGPMLWALLVLTIHFTGTVTMRLRVRREYIRGEKQTARNPFSWIISMPRRIVELWVTELTPCVAQENIVVTFFDESLLFVCLSWFLCMLIVAHVIFGTFLFSSMLFMGPYDSLSVVGRYMASVLVCRMILMYEVAGIREVHNRSDDSRWSLAPQTEDPGPKPGHLLDSRPSGAHSHLQPQVRERAGFRNRIGGTIQTL
jgi:hypothetical protein